MMKKFAIALLALMMLSLVAVGQADTLRVGMEYNYTPYN